MAKMEEESKADVKLEICNYISVEKKDISKVRGGPRPCPVCSMIISNSYNLTLHMRRHNNNKPYKCNRCSAAFAVRYELQSHAVVHTKLRPFKCRFCKKDFKDVRSLRTHFKVHGFKEHKCKYCAARFKTKEERFDHEATSHNRNVNYKCGYCYKFFANPTRLKEHESGVHNKIIENQLKKFKPKDKIVRRVRQINEGNFRYYPCTKCSDRFKFKKDQLAHYKTYHEEEFSKIFENCKLCGKLLTKRYMASHLQAHEGILPFKCNFCDYQTNRKNDLRNHNLIHTKDYRYKCSFCERAFRTNSRALLCEKRHTGLKDVKCVKCEMTFFTKEELEVHENSKHKLRKCQFCDFETSERSKYYRHGQVHKKLNSIPGNKKFTCSTCGEVFAFYYKLRSHYKIHGDFSLLIKRERRHICSYCDYKGSSSTDVLKHCNKNHPEKVNNCDLCLYSTLNINLFRNHMAGHSNICKEDFYLINDPRKIFGFSNNSLVLECFICGFLSFGQEIMKKHTDVHNIDLNKFPWYSSNYNEHLGISFTERKRKKKERKIARKIANVRVR